VKGKVRGVSLGGVPASKVGTTHAASRNTCLKRRTTKANAASFSSLKAGAKAGAKVGGVGCGARRLGHHKATERGDAQRCSAISKVLIANRGEIAVRVIRACKELGLKTVAVYSTADENSLHVQLADEAVCIGPAPSQESYLNVPNILAAATSHGADAIHPGYGFLSENAAFVDICKDHGLNFIGPDSSSITLMGDKSTARDTMKKAGVPTVPGSEGLIENDEEAMKVAAEIGFPLMIKATAGGGGRGMRLATNKEEFLPLMKQAQSEAKAAFGNGDVYIERFVQNPRHIEFQVLCDHHGNCVHLGE